MAKDKDDLQNIDAVLQVSVAANRDLYEEIRKEDDMCQALRDLMSDEIEKELEQKETDTVIGNIKKMMKNLQISAGQAMNALEIPVSEQNKYIALL